MYKKQADGWYTCGCGGKPIKKVEIPEGSVQALCTNPLPTIWTSTLGNKYDLSPNRVILDIHSDDLKEMLEKKLVRQLSDYSSYSGFLGRK